MVIDGFNKAFKNITASYLKGGYVSMGMIRFRTTSKGYLSHLYYILRKPEPLGTEFKTVACYVTGTLTFFEVQRGKEGMKHRNYHKDLVATAAYTKRIM